MDNSHTNPLAFSPPLDIDGLFPPERRTGQPRKNWVREDFFEEPLDVERAYWLGFIYADGSVVFKPRWALRVHLAAKDESHLSTLHARIGGRLSWTKSRLRSLMACSRKLCLSLGRLGVVPRKTYAPCAPPNLVGQEQRAFLRGLFDGNGCLHVSKRGYLQAAYCGHPATVCWIVEQLGIDTNGKPRQRGGAAYAQWTSEGRAIALVQLLYGAPGPRLERKALIAQRYL
ncbi:hypothetical protein MVI01_74770 [Myxococcus virescens]|uniref:DOD-type homing endonuclease domain-containing protein n=1 Tax=Myxococcus virescens TaxID=83456 RepID=A0A511HQ20_9BACT|nr:hypothetical protein MVI01_74770 [Myxococcus virescens]